MMNIILIYKNRDGQIICDDCKGIDSVLIDHLDNFELPLKLFSPPVLNNSNNGVFFEFDHTLLRKSNKYLRFAKLHKCIWHDKDSFENNDTPIGNMMVQYGNEYYDLCMFEETINYCMKNFIDEDRKKYAAQLDKCSNDFTTTLNQLNKCENEIHNIETEIETNQNVINDIKFKISKETNQFNELNNIFTQNETIRMAKDQEINKLSIDLKNTDKNDDEKKNLLVEEIKKLRKDKSELEKINREMHFETNSRIHTGKLREHNSKIKELESKNNMLMKTKNNHVNDYQEMHKSVYKYCSELRKAEIHYNNLLPGKTYFKSTYDDKYNDIVKEIPDDSLIYKKADQKRLHDFKNFLEFFLKWYFNHKDNNKLNLIIDKIKEAKIYEHISFVSEVEII